MPEEQKPAEQKSEPKPVSNLVNKTGEMASGTAKFVDEALANKPAADGSQTTARNILIGGAVIGLVVAILADSFKVGLIVAGLLVGFAIYEGTKKK
jgi:hypothetical protein